MHQTTNSTVVAFDAEAPVPTLFLVDILLLQREPFKIVAAAVI